MKFTHLLLATLTLALTGCDTVAARIKADGKAVLRVAVPVVEDTAAKIARDELQRAVDEVTRQTR